MPNLAMKKAFNNQVIVDFYLGSVVKDVVVCVY